LSHTCRIVPFEGGKDRTKPAVVKIIDPHMKIDSRRKHRANNTNEPQHPKPFILAKTRRQ
jgi:hypothetical protein